MPRHRAVLEKMQQGMPISKAMIAMSYKPSVARNTANITGTKSWAMLMDEYLPEDLVAERHNELLNKRAYRKIEQDGKTMEIEDGPDTPAVAKALEMAYKLRGSFAPEKTAPPSGVVYNMFYQPVIQARVKAFEDALKDSITHEITTSDVLPVQIEGKKSTIDKKPDTGSA